MDTPETRLRSLGLTLPAAPRPAGLYKPALRVDQFLYVSGHVSVGPDGTRLVGRVGADLTLEQATLAARAAGLAVLATIRESLGSLDHVTQVVRLFGMVNATPDFEQHALVVNGCSELFAEVFGHERGVGVRSSAGMSSLPGNAAVEVEAIFATSV